MHRPKTSQELRNGSRCLQMGRSRHSAEALPDPARRTLPPIRVYRAPDEATIGVRTGQRTCCRDTFRRKGRPWH
jgi:hypothetical protein